MNQKELEEQLGLVNRLSKILISDSDLIEIGRDFVFELKELMSIDWGNIALIEKDLIHLLQLSPKLDSGWEPGNSISLKDTPFEWVAKEKRALVQSDLQTERRFWTDEYLLKKKLITAAYMPLFSKGEVFGAIVFASHRREAYKERELKLLRYATVQMTAPIQQFILLQKTDENIKTAQIQISKEEKEEFISAVLQGINQKIGQIQVINNAFEDRMSEIKELLHNFGDSLNMAIVSISEIARKLDEISKEVKTGSHRSQAALLPPTFEYETQEHPFVKDDNTDEWNMGLNSEDWFKTSEETTNDEKEQAILAKNLSYAILSSDNIDELYQYFGSELGQLVQLDWAAVAFLDKPKDNVILTPLSPNIPADLEYGSKIFLMDTPMAWVSETKCSLVESDLSTERKFWTDVLWLKKGIRSLVYLPLFWRKNVYAVLIIGNKKPRAYQDRELKLLKYAAIQLAISLKSFLPHEAPFKIGLANCTK
ncbi:MAG: GAF domain-containing protein [Syntrophaceticus sp.]